MQGCSSILRPLIHGQAGNTFGYFTPVVILKYQHNSQIIFDCYLSNQHENMSLYICWKIDAIIKQLVPRAISGFKMVYAEVE